MSGGARVSSGVKKTIQDIREIAGAHSDEDIYAMLKECSMDPNETAQRLLHLDTFHEVKKKHGRRKENVETREFDNPRKQHGARVSRGAKVDNANFHFQNTSQNNGRRVLGGSKEFRYDNFPKNQTTENKSAYQRSRSGHFKVNGSRNLYSGKNSQVGVHQANEKISTNGDNVNLLSPALQPSPSTSLEAVDIDAPLSHNNPVLEDQHTILNENFTWSKEKIENGSPILNMPCCGDIAMDKLIDSKSDAQPQQANFAAEGIEHKETDKHAKENSVSEDDVSVVHKDVLKLNLSDGHHVVFPEHLQVPKGCKQKLTFGSIDSIWPLDSEQASGCNVIINNTQMDVSHPESDVTVGKASTESSVAIFSTVDDGQEGEDPSHLQLPQPVSGSSPPLTGHAYPDIVIKIDDPKAESLLCNGGYETANSPNNGFGHAPHTLPKAHESVAAQGGKFSASSTSIMGPNTIIYPPGVAHDLVSSPPPAPIIRQTYPPNFLPYGHYYPSFVVPQVQQFMPHGGLHQQPSGANVYMTSAAAAAAATGIKYPYQQQKQGSNAGTDGYIGVPSSYSPYIPYPFPYGLPPVVIPGNVVGDNDHESQLKDTTTIHTAEQPIEKSSGEWIAGSGRTVTGMQVNPFYSLGLGQGHPMFFPPTPAGFGPFGGMYNPAAQTISAPQPTLHPQVHQPQPMGLGEPAAGFYQQQQQQQPQGAHINWNGKQ